MDKRYTRRDFLKIAGAGSALAGATALGCSPAGNKNTVSDAPAGEMTYRTNPGNGDKVSLLGYGCMRWPMTKDEEGRDVIDQETVNGLIDYAMEHGVRHPRKSYYLATKLSNFSNWSRENSMLMYRKSFENMETDYFDYYLLHSIGNGGTKMFEERYFDNRMADFLMKEREAGRIRNLGFSFHGTQETFDYALSLHDKVHWDFVQIQLNYVDWKHASGRNVNADYLYSELEKRGIPAVIMEPLLGGRLSKVPQHVADRLLERNPDGSVASWAFRFAGTPAGVLTVLSGMTYMEHLIDNVKTYSPLVPLNQEELDFLEETAQLMMTYPTVPCNDCKYCMPCPYGIDIPAILLHYNKCVNEGNVANSRESENYRKARRAYLVSYDRAVPALRQADHCTGCSQCNEHCPQSIDIPRELHKIDKYIENLRQDTL